MLCGGFSCGVGSDNGSDVFDECDAFDCTILVVVVALMTLIPVMGPLVTFFFCDA